MRMCEFVWCYLKISEDIWWCLRMTENKLRYLKMPEDIWWYRSIYDDIWGYLIKFEDIQYFRNNRNSRYSSNGRDNRESRDIRYIRKSRDIAIIKNQIMIYVNPYIIKKKSPENHWGFCSFLFLVFYSTFLIKKIACCHALFQHFL